ncbi:MAG: trehalose-phosphatase, partial [Alphaproteobacteria bacterium]
MRRRTTPAEPPPLRANTALFLDADGTLLDIAPTPDAVTIPDGLIETLRRLKRALGGAVAVVSGRRRAELRHFFRGAGIAHVAEHGAAASVALPGLAALHEKRVPPALTAALRRFADGHPGTLLEIKHHGAALHVRRAPGATADARRLALSLAAAYRKRVRLLQAKSVFEFVAHGISKGHAIDALLQQPPFRGRVPYVIGDDVTDEDGFAVANRLRGTSLRVGARRASTAARFTIASADDVRR